MHSEYLETPTARLRLNIYNATAPETVILLHGGPGVPDYTEGVASMFRRMRVISFDQRGTGDSICHNGSYRLRFYLEDLETLADRYCQDTFHLFGHSWGGVYAQLYALHHPGRLSSLLLCDPAPGFGRDWMLMTLEEFRLVLRRIPMPTIARMNMKFLLAFLGRSQANRVYRDTMITIWRYFFHEPGHAPVPPQFYTGTSGMAGVRTFLSVAGKPAGILRPIREALDAVKIGLIYGEHDFLKRSRLITENRYPDIEPVTVPQAGHVPWMSNAQAFEEALTTFYDPLVP